MIEPRRSWKNGRRAEIDSDGFFLFFLTKTKGWRCSWQVGRTEANLADPLARWWIASTPIPPRPPKPQHLRLLCYIIFFCFCLCCASSGCSSLLRASLSFHITFPSKGKQIAKVEILASDSGCCWQRVEVKRIQPYYPPAAAEGFIIPPKKTAHIQECSRLCLFVTH